MRKKLTAIVMAFLICSTIAFSAAPTIKIGDMEVYTLVDVVMTADADVEQMPIVGMSQQEVEKLVPAGKITSQILAFQVKSEGKNYLYDTGLPQAKSKGLASSLEKIGLTPADIDSIIFTHAHYDHIGGMLDENNEIAYKNADHYISAPEYFWWTEEVKHHFYSGDEAANSLASSNHETVVNSFAALEKAGKKPVIFEFGDVVLPGIKALDASGHTPGHTVFELNSGKCSILIVGDIMHVSEVQLPCPEITVVYDTNQDEAREARLKYLKLAAESGVPVAGMHLPVPGVWKVKKDGAGYRFEKP